MAAVQARPTTRVHPITGAMGMVMGTLMAAATTTRGDQPVRRGATATPSASRIAKVKAKQQASLLAVSSEGFACAVLAFYSVGILNAAGANPIQIFSPITLMWTRTRCQPKNLK